jgi:hypothetical protein
MKNKQFLLGVLFTLFIFMAFGTGRAYAVGCFTDTNATAACWLKANGIATPYPDGGYHPNAYLTRIDAATFLYRANKVPPRQGVFHIAQDLNSLSANANFPNAYVERYANAMLLRANTAALHSYQTRLNIPTAMYGRAVYLRGMQVCYGANFGGASLTRVELQLYDVNSNGDPLLTGVASDTTIRTDKTCRLYELATPIKLAGDNQATVIFSVEFTSTTVPTGMVWITALTAILSPSLQSGVLDAPDVMGIPLSDPSTMFNPQE